MKDVESKFCPSLTETSISKVPLKSVFGTMVNISPETVTLLWKPTITQNS